jgi:hypothetical protein
VCPPALKFDLFDRFLRNVARFIALQDMFVVLYGCDV